jgi:hypothetical protein
LHQNFPPSFQIQSQLHETAHNVAAKVNVNLDSNNNESKTSLSGSSGAARRRWIVVRPVDLARECSPKIDHGGRR